MWNCHPLLLIVTAILVVNNRSGKSWRSSLHLFSLFSLPSFWRRLRRKWWWWYIALFPWHYSSISVISCWHSDRFSCFPFKHSTFNSQSDKITHKVYFDVVSIHNLGSEYWRWGLDLFRIIWCWPDVIISVPSVISRKLRDPAMEGVSSSDFLEMLVSVLLSDLFSTGK